MERAPHPRPDTTLTIDAPWPTRKTTYPTWIHTRLGLLGAAVAARHLTVHAEWAPTRDVACDGTLATDGTGAALYAESCLFFNRRRRRTDMSRHHSKQRHHPHRSCVSTPVITASESAKPAASATPKARVELAGP